MSEDQEFIVWAKNHPIQGWQDFQHWKEMVAEHKRKAQWLEEKNRKLDALMRTLIGLAVTQVEVSEYGNIEEYEGHVAPSIILTFNNGMKISFEDPSEATSP